MLSALAGFIAYRLFQAGAPPTPDMAIEEAKRTREVLEHPEVQQKCRTRWHAPPRRSAHSIERNRRELVGSVEDLRVKVKVADRLAPPDQRAPHRG